MMCKAAILIATAMLATLCEQPTTRAQDKARMERTGSVIGELQGRKDAKNGRSVTLEILSPGEEKARAYLVALNPRDPEGKSRFAELLAAVNAARIGDRVACRWVDSPAGSEGGLFVTAFEVLAKADGKKKSRGDRPLDR